MNTLNTIIPQIDGLLAMDLTLSTYDAFDGMDLGSVSDLDINYTDQLESADQQLQTLQEQHETLEAAARQEPGIFRDPQDPSAFKPQFGYDGRLSTELQGPNYEPLYSDADGTLHPKDDPSKTIPLTETKAPPPPPPPPEPSK